MNAFLFKKKIINKNYDNFGCEFLDIESYKPFINNIIENDYIYIDINLINKMVDIEYQENIRRFANEKISNLKDDISKNGLKLPGTIVADSIRVKLQDGNHRFAACKDLGFKTFPVNIEFSERQIKSGGINYQDFIQELLRKAFNDNS